MHPRLLCDGIELAKADALQVLDATRQKKDTLDRDLLIKIASASLRTKVGARARARARVRVRVRVSVGVRC